jgi:glucose-1-phosphate cytidylyltransferase
MKAFILCGGFGSRLDYEGRLHAKPMVRIGNKPVLMHLIDIFVANGINDFVFCTGHKSSSVVDFFVKKKKNTTIVSRKKNILKILYKYKKLKFTASIVYTGIAAGTGGRIVSAYNKLYLNEDFLVTYGDGLANVDIKKLINFHYEKKALITITAVRPKERYGILNIKNRSNRVLHLDEKKKKSKFQINGGFFVFSKESLKKIKNSNVYFEKKPLQSIIKLKKLYAFEHRGFWKSLDTLKDKNDFNKIIKKGKKPWLR